MLDAPLLRILFIHCFQHFFLNVQFDVTFPAVQCSVLSVDAMDISGEEHLDIVCAVVLASCLFRSA